MMSPSEHNPIPNSLRAVIIGAWAAGLVFWELRRALRPAADSKLRRDARNFAMAACAGLVMQFCEVPVAFALARRAETTRSGLVWLFPAPPLARVLISIALLDYTLYWWHYLTHRVPLLWRFHRVHHLDREMDASTALRFHFGEIAISVFFRATQVVLIGPTRLSVAAWQVFLFLSILFHHANVRLPLALERRIAMFIMTPRLHGIHHSIQSHEVNSNWSSGLTIWDWLHGTLRTTTPQHSIMIGVPGLRGDEAQTLGNALLLPFRGAVHVPAMPAEAVRQPLASLE